MTSRWKQAPILVFFLVFTAGSVAASASLPSRSEPLSQETMSLEDLWSGVQGLLPSILSSSDSAPAPKAREDKSPTITKKPAPEQAKPSAPYKVYSAPRFEEEGEGGLNRAPKNVEDREGGEPVAASKELKEGEMPPLLRRAVQGEAPPIGSQYFPVLPRGASEDALPQIVPVASNYELAGVHEEVRRVVLIVHDLSRNASDSVTMMTTLAGADQRATLILSPQFLLASDIARFSAHLPQKGEVVARWPLGAEPDGSGSWQTGGLSSTQKGQKGISSFTVIDLLLLYLADRRIFPNIERIVVAGHGMGADFVQRYAAMGIAPDLLAGQKLSVSFLLSNPSSYLYLTKPRPDDAGVHFGLPEEDKCPDVNAYPYGLDAMNAYARRSGVAAIRERYPARRVMLLLSEAIKLDTFLDMSCAARAQGQSRLDRGRNFARYLLMSFGEEQMASHSFTVIPGAGYDPVTVFGSYCGQAMLLGDGNCGTAKKLP